MRNPYQIAIELEHIASDLFKCDFCHSGTIFSAENIEADSFYEAVSLILFVFSKVDYNEFLDSLYEYKRVNINNIPELDKIFKQFESLVQ